jgi:hypothetical protein
MLLTRKSSITGKEHTRELDITQEQLNHYQTGYGLIQEVFPNLSADDREFIMSGITPEEWNEHMGSEEDLDYGEGSLADESEVEPEQVGIYGEDEIPGTEDPGYFEQN